MLLSAEEIRTLFDQFLSTAEYRDADACRRKLLEEVAIPTILRIIHQRTRVDLRAFKSPSTSDQELACDAYGITMAGIGKRLDSWRGKDRCALCDARTGERIRHPDDLQAYIAKSARNTCNDLSKKRALSKENAESAVRYVLKEMEGLSTWQDKHGGEVGGYTAWLREKRNTLSGKALGDLQRDPETFALAGLKKRKIKAELQKCDKIELIWALLDAANAPVEINDLIDAYGSIRKSRFSPDDAMSTTGVGEDGKDKEIPDPLPTPEEEVTEKAQFQTLLGQLWPRILRLTLKQRIALLFNCKDFDARHFSSQGIADADTIAQSVQMEKEELLAWWADVDLSDEKIAKRFSLSEAQVKNFRFDARRNLRAYLRPFDQWLLPELWRRVVRLKQPQRTVFMLHHDPVGASLLTRLADKSVVSRDEIAKCLEISRSQLDPMWPELPKSLQAIARLMKRDDLLTVCDLYDEACQQLRN